MSLIEAIRQLSESNCRITRRSWRSDTYIETPDIFDTYPKLVYVLRGEVMREAFVPTLEDYFAKDWVVI